MKPIYTYAIAQTDATNLKYSLIDTVRDLNDDKIERFIEMVLGCQPRYTLPARTYNYNKSRIRTLLSFDYLNNKVEYSYEETITKFFITQEEADKYATTGDYVYGRTSSSKSDECCIEASYTRNAKSNASIDEWLNAEVVVEVEWTDGTVVEE